MKNSISTDEKNTQVKNFGSCDQPIERINEIQDHLTLSYDNNELKGNGRKDSLKEVLNNDLFKIISYLKSQERIVFD